MDYILFDKVNLYKQGLIGQIKQTIDTLAGDITKLNEAIYQNFVETT